MSTSKASSETIVGPQQHQGRPNASLPLKAGVLGSESAVPGALGFEPEKRSALKLKVSNKTKLLFVNRSYWPDMEATGQLLTELCEGLAETDDFDVSVLCGQPNFAAERADFKTHGTQIRNNVSVRRTRHTTFDKSSFIGRLINFVSFCISAFFSLLFGAKPDVIVCQTDPPLSPIAACIVAFLRRTKFIVYLQDIYPDIAVQCGKVREGFFIKVLRKFLVWCYCRADRIVVVSNDMRDWLKSHGVDASKVVVIQNWVDADVIYPIKFDNAFRAEHLLDGKFVVMYSGNIGQTQRFDMLLDAAERLKENENIAFLIVGSGVRQQQVMDDVELRGLQNVRFLGYQPKDYLAQSLSAADLQIVMLDRRMTRLMMPSKLYSAFASGTPVLGLGDSSSHLAEIIVDNGCGWFFEESQLDELVDQIDLAAGTRNLSIDAGKAARDLAVKRFNRHTAIANFTELLDSIDGNNASVGSMVASEDGSENTLIPEEDFEGSNHDLVAR